MAEVAAAQESQQEEQKPRPKVAVIFDAFNSLVAVDKKGVVVAPYEALAALQSLKRLGSVTLLAQEFSESREAFKAVCPDSAEKSLYDLLGELYGDLFGRDLFHWVGQKESVVDTHLNEEAIEPHNVYRVSNRLNFLLTRQKSCQTVFFHHLQCSESQGSKNATARQTYHPDHTIIMLD